MLTFTRSAILAALVTTFAALLPSPGRTPNRRARLGLVAIGAIVLALPWIASSGLGVRTEGALNGEDTSTIKHINRLDDGLRVLVSNPQGLGLGSGPSVGNVTNTHTVISENSYLQVGDELGVLPMVMFAALLVLTVRRLGRPYDGSTAGSDAATTDTTLASAMHIAGLGFLVGGFFLHVWIDLHTSLTFWGCAGLALGPSNDQPHQPGRRWSPLEDDDRATSSHEEARVHHGRVVHPERRASCCGPARQHCGTNRASPTSCHLRRLL